MLTVKEPIRLQCAAGRIAVRDDFGDRIRENYSLLSVQFTPKELLLLLSAPPEEQEEQPGMTTLVTQNKVSMYQGVSLEVVNHIVNRILLTQHTPFTYQDTVYISSMLRKTGVTDVSLFMRQVRQMVAQSDSINRLTAIYQLYQNRLPASERARGQEKRSADSKTQAGEKETLRERYFLHSAIYRRLQTSEIYREVGALLTGTSMHSSSVEMREMRLAEQFRAGSELRLAELRQRGVTCLAAALRGAVPLDTVGREFDGGLCVVIGSEGQGLTDAAIDACGKAVKIPMTDRAESLNAAVAGSVLLWHFRGL